MTTKLGTFVMVLLMLICTSMQNQTAPPPARTGTSTAGDIWLTVRLSPSVKAETIELLDQVTEPRTLTLGKNESARQLLTGVYGAFLPRVETKLRTLNPVLKDQTLTTFATNEDY